MSSTDRVEKKKLLRAPRSRVWKALTNAGEFGSWFGMQIDGEFTPGAHLRGTLTKDLKGMTFDLWIDRVDAEHHFSYRWHPFAIDPKVDYSAEPTTLVEFTLAEAEGGTLLTVVESGFDALPPARREAAFPMNARGWEIQVENVARYLDAT